jgi:hypothetical protein
MKVDMRKIVSGYTSPNYDLEPMLTEMCARINCKLNLKRKNKDDVKVNIRIIVEGNHPQAETKTK